jgi:signal-transduction protein with cAMP-binding, CBS, and nucleotidyltransferase domain
MLCPVCRFENFEGEDTCANCGADLTGRDLPQPATEYHDTVLGEHLEALGIGSFRTVAPSLPVAEAIRLMHQENIDRLVGIFTDRDAAVKAVDKRLGLYRVDDFMTPDPVVLRSGDTLAVAIHKMAVGEFRHIPVVDGERPIGVVAAADIFRHLVGALA